MSTLNTKSQSAKSAMQQRVEEMTQLLSSAGYGGGQVVAVPVAVRYEIGVQRGEGSALTDTEYNALLTTLGLTNINLEE